MVDNFSSHYILNFLTVFIFHCQEFVINKLKVNKSVKSCFIHWLHSHVNYRGYILSNLPAKSPTEEKKHRRQYEAMVAEAKKKGENHFKKINCNADIHVTY